jgi:hypothetical protein
MLRCSNYAPTSVLGPATAPRTAAMGKKKGGNAALK